MRWRDGGKVSSEVKVEPGVECSTFWNFLGERLLIPGSSIRGWSDQMNGEVG